MTADDPLRHDLARERESLLEQVQDWLETPMLVLALLWLALFVVETVYGLSPLLALLGRLIWAAFLFEFVLGFVLAPGKLAYMRANWLKALALAAPALRLLRVLRIVRLARLSRVAGMTRGLRLLRVLSSLNRGMRALGRAMSRRGFGYVLTLSLLVLLAGSAGMYAFEGAPGADLDSYGEALWWTAMILVTMGSEVWPQSAEGRILCFFLALYGFAVFGYVTATLATWFIDSDAHNPQAELPGAQALAELHAEIVALRRELRERGGEAGAKGGVPE